MGFAVHSFKRKGTAERLKISMRPALFSMRPTLRFAFNIAFTCNAVLFCRAITRKHYVSNIDNHFIQKNIKA
jgi:hypothetical protein